MNKIVADNLVDSILNHLKENYPNYTYQVDTCADENSQDCIGVTFSLKNPAQGNYYLGGGIVDDTIQVYIIKESTLSVVDSFSYDYVEDNLLSKLSEAINAYNLITSALAKIDNSSRSVLKESAENENLSDDFSEFGDSNEIDNDESDVSDEESESYTTEELAGKLGTIKSVMDQAGDKLQSLNELVPDDTDQKVEITGLSADAYDLALDIQSMIDDILPQEDEEILEESVKIGSRTRKSSAKMLESSRSYLGASIRMLERISNPTKELKSMIESLHLIRCQLSNHK